MKNQWLMLIGTMPVPKSVKRVGRWIYSDGDKEIWVQNVYGSPEELREYAMAGRRSVDTRVGHSEVHDTSPGDSSRSVQWEVVGLKAGAEYVGLKVGTFRNHRRDRGPIPGEGVQGRTLHRHPVEARFSPAASMAAIERDREKAFRDVIACASRFGAEDSVAIARGAIHVRVRAPVAGR